MKIFLLSPNVDTLFNAEQFNLLKKSGDLMIHKEIKPIISIKDLFSGREERILAIDPDFCNWKLENEVIEKMPNLKAIVLQTTSFSWVDSDFAATKKIPVINLRGFSTVAVAEWGTTMALILARRIPLIIKNGWKPDYVEHQGVELRGKVAGVIGLGNIGKAIAENCLGLGMKVQYWSKNSRDARFEFAEIDQLMKTSDVIFPAVAQNEETKGLITDVMLKSMKNTAIFVSIVHHVYNHEFLLTMAQEGQILGYGYETSEIEFDKTKGNVWSGPEMAWCTTDSLKKNAQFWAEAIVKAAKGIFDNKIN